MEAALNSNWILLPVIVPLFGALLGFLVPGWVRFIGLISVVISAAAVLLLGNQLLGEASVQHAVGGWGAPLGIVLQADGLSLLMLGVTAAVFVAVSVHASDYFALPQVRHFWPLWLMLLGALNALFVSGDIFNLYVTLELMTLAAVALTALGDEPDALAGAMRYLLASLLGSVVYLLGVAFLYHQFGTLDITLLGERAEPVPALWLAAGLMFAGLMLKTALFPLHFWLPSAHASAPAPVSAILSALVIKATFYMLLRLWFEIFAPFTDGALVAIAGALGALAILWGSVQALRQQRLKLLIAYSTVAQVGYLFVGFALAVVSNSTVVWGAVLMLVLSHALAKAAMFLAAGNLLYFARHDRIADLDCLAQRLPLSVAAFGLAGVSIMGLPPSGGFTAKWLLLQAAFEQGRWEMLAVLIIGGLLAAVYIFRVLGHAFTPGSELSHTPPIIALRRGWPALLLALAAVLLGLLTTVVLDVLAIGNPVQLVGGPG
ncbi:complex I subunit 5 family protein [Thiohalophilus sp.]|uniref:complex I subunit 5 family protein n=1 Tax=Thiohalophilus sp. TaxID=3028392 RepID=UPI00397503B6